MEAHVPEVAIIIPCFNRWPHVCEAIDSVLGQTWPSTHCVVVDDASTDGSDTQLKAHYANEPRVTIHRLSHNQGQSAARNMGVRLSTANFVGFLDSDDLLYPEAVETRMAIFHEHPRHDGIVFGDKVDEHTGESRLPGSKVHGANLSLSDYVADMGWLHTNSFLMKRSSFLGLGGFNERLRKMEDIEFFLRALSRNFAMYAPGPCCVVRDVTAHRARHDHQRIIAQGEAFIQAIETDPTLIHALSDEEARALIEGSVRSVLQSYYRLKDGKGFRAKLRDGMSKGRLRLNGRLIKRYLISYFYN